MIKQTYHLPMFTLLLLIPFASVNAILFSPALPNIATFFKITEGAAQATVVWFLIGYALGQLLYGPLANRYSRKGAIIIGVIIQIISSLFCVLAGTIHSFDLLLVARFFLAIGSAVGLQMTFTLVNEAYPPQIASQKISHLVIAFAIAPGLAVALGGVLNHYFDWQSCFIAGMFYGVIIFILTLKLKLPTQIIDMHALEPSHLLSSYGKQFTNVMLLLGSFLMGVTTALSYLFSTIAPFIAINRFHMTSAHYGLANIIPSSGLLIGAVITPKLFFGGKLKEAIWCGICISILGIAFMYFAAIFKLSLAFILFFPMLLIYLGTSMILPNTSTLALSRTADKSHGSASMNFINMSVATLSVLSVGFFNINTFLIPNIFSVLTIFMIVAAMLLSRIPP